MPPASVAWLAGHGQAAAIRLPPDDPQGARREVPVIIDRVLRTGEGKILRQLRRIADQVNSIEEDFAPLSDAELRAMTGHFRHPLDTRQTLHHPLPTPLPPLPHPPR